MEPPFPVSAERCKELCFTFRSTDDPRIKNSSLQRHWLAVSSARKELQRKGDREREKAEGRKDGGSESSLFIKALSEFR